MWWSACVASLRRPGVLRGHTMASMKNMSSSAPPLSEPDHFGVHKLFTVEDLFKARVHLGHTPRRTQPNMRPFIFGSRFDTSIIDLDQTAPMLRRALNFMAHMAARGGIFLFVCKQPHLVHLVERTAMECKEYSHCRNWRTVNFLDAKAVFDQEIRFPDVIVLPNIIEGIKYSEHPVVIDAAKMNIPTVGVVDTDCNPNLITYPIPGNDDTIESIQLYLHLFKSAILLGKKEANQAAEAIPAK